MNSLSSYIESGILEAYVLGITTVEEASMVEKMALAHPEIKKELEQIEISLEQYAADHAVEPHATMKPLLFASIDYSERLKNGEAPGFPPLLNENSDASVYAEWLNRPDMVLPADSDNVFLKIIGATPEATTAIVWLREFAPDEVHHDEHECFLIIEGSCDIRIGDKVHQLVPGDFLNIPLHIEHEVKVTSSIPCKIILQRSAA